MRKTKIICTLGPATNTYDMLKQMHEAGMDIIRLNMSHATHEWADAMIQHIVELNKHTRFPVGISFPAGSGLVAFAAATGVMPLDMPESVLVRFKGEMQPGITLRDLVNAVPYAEWSPNRLLA